MFLQELFQGTSAGNSSNFAWPFRHRRCWRCGGNDSGGGLSGGGAFFQGCFLPTFFWTRFFPFPPQRWWSSLLGMFLANIFPNTFFPTPTAFTSTPHNDVVPLEILKKRLKRNWSLREKIKEGGGFSKGFLVLFSKDLNIGF